PAPQTHDRAGITTGAVAVGVGLRSARQPAHDAENDVNLSLFFSALRARFGVFALLLLSTVLAATVVSLLLPKTYRATASLLVDAYNMKDEQSLALSTVLIPQRERINYIQTQMEIITCKRVARKIGRASCREREERR